MIDIYLVRTGIIRHFATAECTVCRTAIRRCIFIHCSLLHCWAEVRAGARAPSTAFLGSHYGSARLLTLATGKKRQDHRGCGLRGTSYSSTGSLDVI